MANIKSARLHVRLDPQLRYDLEMLANAKDRKLSNYVQHLLKTAAEREKAQQSKKSQ